MNIKKTKDIDMELNIDLLLQQGISAHQAGNLQEAERCYKNILQIQSTHPHANHNLGALYVSINKSETALNLFKTALQVNPNIELFWISYINALINERLFTEAKQALKKAKRKGANKNKLNDLNQYLISQVNRSSPPQSDIDRLTNYYQDGNYDDAETLAKSITEQFPKYPFGWKVLGAVFKQTGRLIESLAPSQKCVQLEPKDAEVQNNLGNTLDELGRFKEAEASYKQAIALKPDYAKAHNNLGVTLQKIGKLDEAEACYKQAITLKSDYAEVHINLGVTLKELGRLKEAEENYKKAIDLKPDYAEAHYNLGLLRYNLSQFEEAEANYKKAIDLKPDYAEAHYNLAIMLQDLNQFKEAEVSYNNAIAFQPDYNVAYNNKNFNSHYSSLRPPLFIYQQHLEFEKQFGGLEVRTTLSLPVKKQPGDKLRVGYVSGDFKKHSVAYFFEPLLQHHNANAVETFCYYNDKKIDEITDRLITTSNNWHSIFGVSDTDVVNLIKNDNIDILVDLSGHTDKNRLLVFAQKPAPIQVTWLGYPNTTGLSAIDYRLTDIIADPIGEADDLHSETLLRLPNGFQCYKGDQTVIADVNLPQKSNGYITFGSFNNLSKVTPEVIQVWSKILHAIPTSRLILKNSQLNHGKKQLLELFKQEGIAEDQIKLYGTLASMEEHLKLYSAIDIGLDPFPYNGATTTCEALWMGVPVITLLGDRHVGRVGASILTNVGLTDFIAQDIDHYVELAIKMASNIEYLQDIRQGLRKKMESSPLCNGKSFACDIENAYQDMWNKYLKQNEVHNNLDNTVINTTKSITSLDSDLDEYKKDERHRYGT
jgi:protein O-GlcNAc transferase